MAELQVDTTVEDGTECPDRDSPTGRHLPVKVPRPGKPTVQMVVCHWCGKYYKTYERGRVIEG